jgi:hypothetical protein
VATTAIERDAAGRFVAGQSGNPAGKRPGTRNRQMVLMEALLQTACISPSPGTIRRMISVPSGGLDTALAGLIARRLRRAAARG